MERKRKARDPKRARNQAAYRYIEGFWERNKRLPDTEELRNWIADAGYSPLTVKRLIQDMLKHGWLLPYLDGYQLKTILNPLSVIEGLIKAIETNNKPYGKELIQLWRDHQARATGKATRNRRADRKSA